MSASGNKWVAWIGLLSAGISLLGLYLWWPLRKSFRFSKLAPQNNRHASFFMSHFSGGVVCLVFLICNLSFNSLQFQDKLNELQNIRSGLAEQDVANLTFTRF